MFCRGNYAGNVEFYVRKHRHTNCTALFQTSCLVYELYFSKTILHLSFAWITGLEFIVYGRRTRYTELTAHLLLHIANVVLSRVFAKSDKGRHTVHFELAFGNTPYFVCDYYRVLCESFS